MPSAPTADADLRFFGAADTVTGSRYLIERGTTRVLVDCGLFQGLKVLRERNRAPFPVPPASIDAVVLTHAHLDHTGYLPALVRDGFAGRVYATPATAELAAVMLPDSAHLLEEEARHAASHHWSSHERPEPLYTVADAEEALSRLRPVEFSRPVSVADGVEISFTAAGHILGAAGVHAVVQTAAGSASLHFSGDLGRSADPVMRAPAPLEECDLLVVESTYGDRAHSPVDAADVLEDVITRTARAGGVVLIPAFAVGRTESVLLQLSRLQQAGRLPDMPIFLNSPMAIEVAGIYHRHPEEHRLTPEEVDRMYRIATPVHSVDESKLLNLRGGPMIIISASGMLTGGRILHHLAAYADDPRNAIVLTGYQAAGTRGAALRSGARSLRIFGRDMPVRAEVAVLDSLSAHADADEILRWMRGVSRAPRSVYVTHGEAAASDTLRRRIKNELGWQVHVPEQMQRVPLPIAHLLPQP